MVLIEEAVLEEVGGGGMLPGLGNDGEGAIDGVEGVEEGPLLSGGREMGRWVGMGSGGGSPSTGNE